MCKKQFADETLEEIRKRSADTTIEMGPYIHDEMRNSLDAAIRQNGHARLFMYERKDTGGKGIRIAAHFDSFEDIKIKDHHDGKMYLTRFNVKGYEVFDPPLKISTFINFEGGEHVKASQGLGKSFAYVRDPNDVKGRDMSLFVMLAWNADNWQAPSGSMTNPKEKSYYANFGFGHEEWNFRDEHGLDGLVYGFMMARPASLKRLGLSTSKPFPVYFYAPHGDDFFLIGGYFQSRYVSDGEIERLQEFHKTSGIIDERVNELLPIVQNRATFGKINGFNILGPDQQKRILSNELLTEGYSSKRYLKCPIEKAVLLPQPIAIDRYLTLLMMKTSVYKKYSRPLYLHAYPVILNRDRFTDEPKMETSTEDIKDILEPSIDVSDEGGSTEPHDISFVRYTLHSQTKEYRNNEYELVNRFMAWLQRKYGIQPYKESREIDLRFEYKGASFGVEAKYSDGKMRFPIRSALGQILEYNFYPGRPPKDRWIILLNRKPTREERKWVKRISIGPPITLCWEKENDFCFVSNPLE